MIKFRKSPPTGTHRTFSTPEDGCYPAGIRTMRENLVENTYYRDVALILISTPAGKLNLFNASIVRAVACLMSINRL
jgi:hypothetical protein